MSAAKQERPTRRSETGSWAPKKNATATAAAPTISDRTELFRRPRQVSPFQETKGTRAQNSTIRAAAGVVVLL